MKDQFQRSIDYARISITDRCNLYCTYCRPDHEEMLSHEEILRYEEILRVCKILTTLGIDKFKITGGEPLVRKGCSDFIRELKKTDGVNKVTLTTNAILLSKDLVKLAEAGVDGINISLDFMDHEKYKKITGFDGYKQVISVINKAVNIGLNIKINVVLTEQTTMEDIQKFIDYMKDHKICIRFIEQMPLGNKKTTIALTRNEIRKNLKDQGIRFHKTEQRMGNGPAVYETMEGYKGMIGWIEALHGKFCDTCNRIRLTSIGGIKPCLYYEEAGNLRDLLRKAETSDEEIKQVLKEIIYKKPQAHHFEEMPSNSKMYTIGG